MRKVGLWLYLLAGLSSPVWGQVAVDVGLDQEQFLPGEAIPVSVKISNRSGQKLNFGTEVDWLTFAIESRDGVVVQKIGEAPVVGAFDLESAERATKHVDIAPYFSVRQPGRYSIIATVRIKEWGGQPVSSQPKSFNVVEGAKLWEQEFGVPTPPEATNAIPEVRKYVLQQANFLKGKLRLYLRLTDASGTKVFRVVPIGIVLSFSRPEPRLDKFSNLHLLYQNWAHSSSYTVFNPDGEILERQTYDYTDTRPRLQVDADGRISVAGGARKVTSNGSPANAESR
jgi:hypothetical protein